MKVLQLDDYRHEAESECPFCYADSCRVEWADQKVTSYTYHCRDCGHLWDSEFHFGSRGDPTDWKDD